MTFHQYTYLSELEREVVLWSKGVQVAWRVDKKDKYVLFQLDKFYVEVKCSIVTETIMDFTAFEDGGRLDPYLSLVNINI